MTNYKWLLEDSHGQKTSVQPTAPLEEQKLQEREKMSIQLEMSYRQGLSSSPIPILLYW